MLEPKHKNQIIYMFKLKLFVVAGGASLLQYIAIIASLKVNLLIIGWVHLFSNSELTN